jgi:uncharacterized protein YggE
MFSRKILYSGLLIVSALAFAVACTAAGAPLSAVAGGQGGTSNASGVAQVGVTTGRGITVVGVGKASGTPDVAHITIGVDTDSDSVQNAVESSRDRMTALLEALKAAGIADSDIRTTNYSVYTQQQPIEGRATFTLTYRVSNQVDVTVRDVDTLGDVLDQAVAAGANNIYGVSFSVEDTSKLEADARTKAIADAKARATSLAQLAGVEVGEVVSISEVIGGGVQPLYRDAAMGMGGGGTPIQPGELSVDMSVQVTFAIK